MLMSARARSPQSSPGLLSPTYAATSIGTFALIAFVAFEAMAVTTVMPDVARALDGVGLYALSFAAPLASGVIGMVAAGMWSDRHGPVVPLLGAMAVFSLGLLVCGLAPTMEVLVAGRVLQGLGGGALVVGLYVVVGKIYPSSLQPAVFASFAAAWVLPALFGPVLAAWVAQATHWRWVFVGMVGLVAAAGLLIAPALRGFDHSATAASPARARLAWAVVGGTAVLLLELLGSAEGLLVLAAGAFVLTLVALRRLTPAGTLALGRGLPAVIATRGLLSAGFFCTEAYIVFVLQEQWGLTAARAGLALTGVGVVWALASQVQSRLGTRVTNERAMQVGTSLVLLGTLAVLLSVWLDGPAFLAGASYVLAGAGMGFAYPRTTVAVLAESGDSDRGFNTSALTVADSLGAALALSVSGIVFAAAVRLEADRFVWVFALSVLVAAVGVLAGRRTVRPALSGSPAPSSPAAPAR